MSGLFVPFALLVGAAAGLPFLVARLLPEGVAGLALNAVLCAVVLWMLSSAYFWSAYGRADPRVVELIEEVPGTTLWHVLRLGLSAGLIWAPVLVLGLSAQPRRWKDVEW